jgi:hypothetical protein
MMKASYLILFFLFTTGDLFAQEPADALRYSFLTQFGGTARNQAIGGAGGALGGEFTSMFINPAGLGFYKTGDFAFTPSFSFQNSKSNYLSNPESAKNNSFSIGTTGFILASPSKPGKSIRSVSVGFGVNRAADFNNHVYYKGTNKNSSSSEQYLEQLIDDNVTDPNDAANNYPDGTSLAFNTYLIDTVQKADGSLGGYRTQANPATGLIQENNINTRGGITDAAVAVGVNVQDKWYFGGTLTFPFLSYHRDGSYKETDASNLADNNFNYYEANETLDTKGVGINGKFGVIFKPVEDLRLGLAYHTATSYQLTDDYNNEIITDLEGYGGEGVKHQSSTDLNSGQLLESKYKLTTPGRWILSGSLVLRETQNVENQRGFISADVEYVNYKNSSFHDVTNTASTKSYYGELNGVIDNLYQDAINVRLGGELKFNTIMVRLGGAYYGNPYENESANLFKIAGGLGYRNHGMFVDLTYVYSMNKDINYPYLLEDKPNVPAYLKNNVGSIIATVGFKL